METYLLFWIGERQMTSQMNEQKLFSDLCTIFFNINIFVGLIKEGNNIVLY